MEVVESDDDSDDGRDGHGGKPTGERTKIGNIDWSKRLEDEMDKFTPEEKEVKEKDLDNLMKTHGESIAELTNNNEEGVLITLCKLPMNSFDDMMVWFSAAEMANNKEERIRRITLTLEKLAGLGGSSKNIQGNSRVITK